MVGWAKSVYSPTLLWMYCFLCVFSVLLSLHAAAWSVVNGTLIVVRRGSLLLSMCCSFWISGFAALGAQTVVGVVSGWSLHSVPGRFTFFAGAVSTWWYLTAVGAVDAYFVVSGAVHGLVEIESVAGSAHELVTC